MFNLLNRQTLWTVFSNNFKNYLRKIYNIGLLVILSAILENLTFEKYVSNIWSWMQKFQCPSRACIEVFHVFVSSLTLLTSFFYDACKILYSSKFDCCRELLQNISIPYKKPDCDRHVSFFPKFSMQFSNYYMQWKFSHFMDFLLCPLKGFICNRCFLLGKKWKFSNL